ncbi:glycosyltransferase [Geodermatophilus sp. URMC 65]
MVATDVIGTAEVVAHGMTGTLVPPQDPPAFTEALAELLVDPDLRHRYARAGRRRCVAHFTSRRMAEDTLRSTRTPGGGRRAGRRCLPSCRGAG